jgi:hypothetical protein
MTLRALVLTHNEAAFIEGCLASIVPLTADILVLDSGSSDRTRELAEEMGARVVKRAWQGFSAQRNAALELASDTAWVLFVDADERLTPALRHEIVEAVSNAAPEVAGFLIPRRNVVCGRVMRGGGWWPDYQPRLLRPERCRYDERAGVHEVAGCDGALFALNFPMVHLNYLGWIEFVTRQLRYARLAGRSGDRPHRRRYLGAPAREFSRRYVNMRGYRDGATGLSACVLVSLATVYEVWLARKTSPS